ncbi:MbnP family protein [Pontibacter actiniarum]|uniref:Copper-binding protein MbnP-like domain-containing protein n=1 Tax=Pontibacter actiniarum TaxID=323450 RepID=A0A1X9YMI2_9BACT|nr:MbnP family protein [Pontibacter actiniarum]ARS34074.1 hypothetical protein CA264_00700 [Pontibacter actiniarum]
MKPLQHILSYILLPLTLLATSCEENDTPEAKEPGTVTLDIHHTYNSEALQLNQEYATEGGTGIKFRQLRYILSNVVLTTDNGATYKVPDSYYIVEHTPTHTREQVALTGVPAGSYTSVSFAIGVDQTVNHSLDLAAGELATVSGMAWSWNTGYKFIVAEGEAFNAATGAWENYTYHVGTDANYRTVTLALPNALQVEKQTDSQVMLVAETGKLFNQVDVLQYKMVMSGAATAAVATQVAANYASMFSVHHAHSMKGN